MLVLFLYKCLYSQLQTLEDKLNWIFNVFDKDGGGSIDPSELREIVRGLFCLAGIKVPDEILDNRCQVNIIELQTKVSTTT